MSPAVGALVLAFFILGMWVAHQLDKQAAKLKRFFDTIPDGSGKPLTGAKTPQEYGEEAPTVADAVKQKTLAERIARRESTEWERAHHREVWEHFCAKEDAKRGDHA